MANKDFTPLEKLTYEEALVELEGIVQSLEAGQQPLEKSMLLFERGQALARWCAELLDRAELKVRTLNGEALELPEEA